MAVIQIKKYKYLKENGKYILDENKNKIKIPKSKDTWKKETSDGTKTWYFCCRYKIEGKTKQYMSKLYALKREAETEERIFLADPLEYINSRSKKRNQKTEIETETEEENIEEETNKKIVLSDYYDDFFEYDCKVNKESTAYDHKTNYYKHIAPILGNEKPENITIEKINYFHEEIEKKQLAFSTNTNINSVLVKLLEYIIRKGVIKYNYAKIYGGFKRNKEDNVELVKEIKYQTVEEFQNFMTIVDDIYWQAFFTFLFWHGLRKGEQQALRWCDIDFDKKYVMIHNTVIKSKTGGTKISNTTKNRRNRTIMLAEQCVDVMKKYYNICKNKDNFNKDWLIFGFGDKENDIIARNTIDRKIKDFYKILEEKDNNINILTHHSFGRHSHATYLYNELIKKGVSREETYEIIAQRLGDTPEVIRSTYAHSYDRMCDEKLKTLLS